ncbi:hypothetical protein OR16_19061 [Cupriavidus basilensis OR16]|uniref:Uncharacterized protein n=1 Tax=Cupriavidus basilensis OR16 TaxID=1127483 RepID=H1S7A7_9BURK|nr:hypothetical protein OR16_19061 [Cupriavidus basilensis OR16]
MTGAAAAACELKAAAEKATIAARMACEEIFMISLLKVSGLRYVISRRDYAGFTTRMKVKKPSVVAFCTPLLIIVVKSS